MLFRRLLLGLTVTVGLFLQGCASPPQTPIALNSDFYKPGGGKVVVALSEVPKPDTAFPGADCLLCLGVASAMHSTLTTAVQSWPVDDWLALGPELQGLLKSKGQTVELSATPFKRDAFPQRSDAKPGESRFDFRALKASSGADKALVVRVHALGIWRNYSAYIPTGVPRAVLKGDVLIVDLNTQQLEWYEPFDLSQSADGNWDEPPKFAGLANAYFQVIERGKDRLKQALSR